MMTNDFKSLVTSGVKQSSDNWGTGIILQHPQTKMILLAKRTDTGTYGGPGGKVELKESPLEGIIRECKEESNITINSMVCYGDNLHDSPNGKNWVDFLFYSDDFDDSDIQNQASEMEPFAWYSVTDALGMDLFPPTRTALEMAYQIGLLNSECDDSQNYIPFTECPTSATEVVDSPCCQYSWCEPEKIFTTHQWLYWD